MIGATVEIDQPQADGRRIYGTGFLVDDPKPDGTPRTVLITAGHVLVNMAGQDASIGFRRQDGDGTWHYAAQPLTIRSGASQLWVRDPRQDIAAIAIEAPAEFARAAIPIAWLADDAALAQAAVEPGDEMFVLGFPEGRAANPQGFPILRVGRVASYPLTPTKEFQTFLLDFNVFNGNSGSPVFLSTAAHRRTGAPEPETPLVAGVITSQTVIGEERLALGIVVEAQYVRDTLKLLDPAGALSAGATSRPTNAASPPR
jgi:V8-like Glu-specific endopeptidase